MPQFIRNHNQKPFFHKATKEELKSVLLDKLKEELEEFRETPNEEELADILEVIDGMVKAFNLDLEQVLTLKANKKAERGGFEEGIILEGVMDSSKDI